eukprot:TRINITY_DN3663_c0_g2_i2.p1 TRINITY_DN3663_c0_g2~~TRINITY_DN3663_c0_g2_i2.p1  ORF type:complete len:1182 (+),score=188.42 TRINITY_DN3663_c0_g2_i2:74-3619(+)
MEYATIGNIAKPCGILATHSESPSSTCHISISANCKTIALAEGAKVVLYDLDSSSTTTVHLQRDHVTCIQCLAIPDSKKQTRSRVTPLSLCVAIGCSSGYMRLVSDAGVVLIEQLFHKAPIVKMHMRSAAFPAPMNVQDETEDLTIVYKDACVVHIDGSHLVSALRQRLLQIASDHTPSEPIRVEFTKFSVARDRDTVEDTICCGLAPAGPFEFIAVSPATFRFISCGSAPAFALYRASQEEESFSITTAAAAVVLDVGSMLFSKAKSWWRGGATEQVSVDPQEAIIKAPIALDFTQCIRDPGRVTTSIELDPTGKYAATTDTFGRVMLINVEMFCILRMWKGYRDAQVCFVQNVASHTHPGGRASTPHFATLIAIYAPRRGLLEVWRLDRRERVAVGNVGHGCRLLAHTAPLGGRKAPARCFLLHPDAKLVEIKLLTAMEAAMVREAERAKDQESSSIEHLIGLCAEYDSNPEATSLAASTLIRSLAAPSAKAAAEALPRNASAELQALVLGCASEVLSLAGNTADSAQLAARAVLMRQYSLLLATNVPTLDESSTFGEGSEVEGLRADLRDEARISAAAIMLASPADFVESFVMTADNIRSIAAEVTDEARYALGSVIFSSLQHNMLAVEGVKRALIELQIASLDLLDLFLCWFLNLPSHALQAMPIAALRDMIQFVLQDGGACAPTVLNRCQATVRMARACAFVHIATKQHEALAGELSELLSQIETALAVRRVLIRYSDPHADSLTVLSLQKAHQIARIAAAAQLRVAADAATLEKELDRSDSLVSALSLEFPLQCSFDHVRCHRAAILFERWESAVSNVELVALAVEHLQQVEDLSLRSSMAYVLWTKYCGARVGQVALLVEHVHGKPKKQSLRKELGMKASQIVRVTDSSASLLEIACQTSHEPALIPTPAAPSVAPVLRTWPSDSLIDEARASFHTPPDRAVLMAHSCLALIVSFTLRYDLHDVLVGLLVPLSGGQQFFQPKLAALPDDSVQALSECQNFIRKVAAVDFDSAAKLAPMLQVSIDVAQIAYVVSLYRSGRDQDGADALRKAKDTNTLALELLRVVRDRLARVLIALRAGPREFTATLSVVPHDAHQYCLAGAPTLKAPGQSLTRDSVLEELALLPGTLTLLQWISNHLPKQDKPASTELSNVDRTLQLTKCVQALISRTALLTND